MSALLLAVVSQAHALRIVCAGFEVADTVPRPGAVDVPVDVRPAVTFTEGCIGPSAWEASLLRDEDGAEVTVASAPHAELAESFLFEIFPEAALDPMTAYTLTVSAFEGESVEVGFTTGTGTVAGLTAAPTVSVESAGWDRGAGELIVALRATPAADPDALSVLQVKDEAINRGVQSFVVPATGDVAATVVWKDSRKPDEVCPQVRQIDGAGVATDWSTPDCVPVSTCGCATTTPTAGVLGVALVLAMAIRRRA